VSKVAVMARRAGGRARVLALSSVVLVMGKVSVEFTFDLAGLDGGLIVLGSAIFRKSG
jgi:hypothetical protein